MNELTRVKLENEMDLIITHKRTMKLAEMTGLSLPAQTTFATAVSEVARMSLETKKEGSLSLGVIHQKKERFIVAALTVKTSDHSKLPYTGLEYAKRLVANHTVTQQGSETIIKLFYYISSNIKFDTQLIDSWRSYFRNEPPVSPYDELKRKNEQLQELSEKLQKSEAEYTSLSNTLPLFIFSIDAKGKLLYANRWLTSYTGLSQESLNSTHWSTVIHPDDYPSFLALLSGQEKSGNVILQTRIRSSGSNEYKWHQVSLSPFRSEATEVQFWTGYIVDIHTQKEYEQTLKDNADLKEAQEQLKQYQKKLEANIAELNRSNYDLQQYAFIASHDLQEPIRKIMFSSDYLLTRYGNAIDEKGLKMLRVLFESSGRMRSLVKDLLDFSQVDKNVAEFESVDLSEIAQDTIRGFELRIAEKDATINVGSLPSIYGDKGMMRQLFDNIVSNGLKYSKIDEPPVINIDIVTTGRNATIVFKDNGIGFNERHLNKMFDLFQRLHRKQEYEGTGIGLAICRKIIDIHGGKIWAEGKENEGASFFVELPMKKSV